MFRKFTALLSLLICATLLLSGAAFAVSDEREADSASNSKKAAPVYKPPTQAVDIYQAFLTRSFTASDKTVIPYRIFVPDGYTADAEYPLFLFLHGAGERGNDNSAQLRNAVQNLFNDLNSPIYGAIVVCPQCPNDNQWVDTPWSNGNYSADTVPESNELKAVVEMLNYIQAEYSVDDSRIYGMGLSMGGFGIWDLMMRHTELFTAGVPVCGGADPSRAGQLVEKPIWTFHGDADGIVPISGTRAMVNAIKAAGGSTIIYEELPGYGHNVWDYASTRDGVMNWLFSQITPCETHTDQYLDNGDGTHRHVCSVCGTVLSSAEQHTGEEDGDCTTPVTCICGAVLAAGKSHDFTGAFASDDTGHWHTCGNTDCMVAEDKQPHRGGTATYFDRAICADCQNAYGKTALDITAPMGEIKTGDVLLSATGEHLFFKDARTVRILASDTESGVEAIEYFLSENEVEDPSHIVGWKAYTKEISLDSDGTYVLYARLTDRAGNSAVISSGMVTRDSAAPKITGIENGKAYCDAVTVEITDVSLDTVMLNGVPASLSDGRLALSQPGEQVLVATDRAGNSVTVKVTLHDGHVWGKDEVLTAATAEKEGQLRHTCERCGKAELQVIPKKASAASDIAKAENTFPKTGDHRILWPWLVTAAVSGGIWMTRLFRKRETTC